MSPVLLSILITGSDFTLPKKPNSIRFKEYEFARKCADSGEKGNFDSAIAGIRSLRLTNPVVFSIESTNSKERAKLTQAIEYASQSWNQWLGREVFKISPKGSVRIRMVDVTAAKDERHIVGQIVFSRILFKKGKSYSYGLEGKLEIARDVDGSPTKLSILKTIALHEVGHLLGLADNNDPYGLMGPYNQTVKTALSDDEEQDLLLYRATLEAIERRLSSLKESSERIRVLNSFARN